MPMIPAFCMTCGTAFPSGGFVENVERLNIRGTVSPCPKCGGTGKIMEGVFRVTINTIEIISAPTWTVERLIALQESLKSILASDEPEEEKRERILKEAPELSSLKDALPKTRSELYAFIALLILALQALSECSGMPEIEIGAPKVEYAMNRALEDVQS